MNRLLRNPSCGAYFGDRGPQQLNQTTYRFINLGNSSTGAATLTRTHVVINTRGIFLNPPNDGTFFLSGSKYSAGDSSGVQGFVLLHELGHQLSEITGFGPDASDTALNTQQSLAVVGACY
jgi:hypothetical protein